MTITPGPESLPAPAACLIVLDGWGLAEPGPGNAVELADTPNFDELWERYPHTQLTACGRSVGLPEGQMGNSEVGHLNLGAGAIIRQDLTRIDDAVADGSFDENPVLRAALTAAPRVHLIGLVSGGGVHSSLDHLQALIRLAANLGTEDLVIHAFTDGRDTLPHSGEEYLGGIEELLASTGNGRIGSVIGRYFAMDRDKRWERVQKAYDLVVKGESAFTAASAVEAVQAAYARDETDEFIEPTLVGEESKIRPGDSVLCFNFRPDRVREITLALTDPALSEINRDSYEPVKNYATMTEYVEGWSYPVAYPPERPGATIAEVIAEQGGGQLHVAETEKYPHVTYFFNGGEETPYSGEERALVPSPRDVPTYDFKPEMSAYGVAAAFVERWETEKPMFGVINFANPDMVGHTGVIPAAVKAIETVDGCLREVVEAVHRSGGCCVITADHGNADNMLEPDGSPNTAHSLNPVPLIVTTPDVNLRDGGVLADVAPTLLGLIGVTQPKAMTGLSLVV